MENSLVAILMILLTVLSSFLGKKIRAWSKQVWLHPLIVATTLLIVFLLFFDIPYERYNIGGEIISYVLGPITVVLSVPLYQNRSFLKKYYKAILFGIFIGSIIALLSIYLISFSLDLDSYLMKSLFGKSVTTPIGIVIAEMLKVNPSITVLSIIFTGVFTISISTLLFKIFKIEHPVAKGVALGTAAHAIGTAKAMEKNKIEGAMSALSIGLTGLFTVFWILLFTLLI